MSAGADSKPRRASSGAKSRVPATLSRRLGHAFAHPEILTEALTHRGAAPVDAAPRFGNERLEFLGDRVLGLVIADLLHESFPEEPEGVLARRFNGLVRREALEEVAATLDLGRHLILAKSEETSGARKNRGLQADACEALIGALYLDGGLETARQFILKYWQPLIAEHGGSGRDPKTRLQEWTQARGLGLPRYREVGRKGPAHELQFTVSVEVSGYAPAEGRAASKRSAERVAAEALLAAIEGGDGP
ncbi:MAG: ribonuclease III [Alphaproteobacteria bacterium]